MSAKTSFTECPSCGTKLLHEEKFCPNCGQANKSIRGSFIGLIRNFFEDYLAFDSKLIRTLKPLLLKPGILTLEFVKHKRSLYVPPLRLYLFFSFLYFLIASLAATFTDPTKIAFDDDNLNQGAPIVIGIDGDRASFEKKLDSLNNINPDSVPSENYTEARFANGLAKLVLLPGRQRDNLIRSNTPIALLGLIPFYAVLIRLFNFKKRRFFVDDVVFMSHFLSAALIIGLVLKPISIIFNQNAIAQFIWFLGMASYFIISYKRVYNRSHAVAIFYGGFQYLILLMLFGAALLLLMLYIVYFKV